ncbi:MAG: hypothetical protein JNN08_17450 [Bryobacterales bacterium]|nr:hypothetical protein [Bryobacterales bacterium]
MRKLLWLLPILVVTSAWAQTPVVTAVVEAASQIPPRFPGYGIPPGGVMRIAGSNLGPATTVSGFPSFPLGTELAGTSVKVRSGQMELDALVMSVQAAGVLAILPSATPLGSATLTVTHQGRTSAGVAIRVADVAGIYTLNGRFAGPALVLNSRFEPVTLINPARPGETVMLLVNARVPEPAGAVAAAEDLEQVQHLMAGAEPEASVDPRRPASFGQLFLQDQVVPSLMSGRLFPGIAYELFRIPANQRNSCWTSLYFRDQNTMKSNIATISVADSSLNICDDPIGPSMRDLFRKATPGDVPFTVKGTFNRIDFKRDFGGSGGGQAFITKAFYEEGPIDFQYFKDAWEISFGCYADLYSGQRPPVFPDARYVDLGPDVQLLRGGITERLRRASASLNVYQFTAASNPLSPFGPIDVLASGSPLVPGFRSVFQFPFAIPTTPIGASLVAGRTIDALNDLQIRLTNLPNRPDHHVEVGLSITLANLSSSARILCRMPPAELLTIPSWLLGMIPDGGANPMSLTVIYAPNRPYTSSGLPDRIGYADVGDRIYSVLTGNMFRNSAAQ